eukprot:9470217-Pyramimonas_sp.AAC.1
MSVPTCPVLPIPRKSRFPLRGVPDIRPQASSYVGVPTYASAFFGHLAFFSLCLSRPCLKLALW